VEEFDIVASAYTIHNLRNSEKKTLIPSIYRALTTKGFFINADIISQDSESEHKKELNFMLGRAAYFDEIKKPELKQEWIDHYKLDATPERKITESEYITLLQNAGFKDIRKTYREHMEATFVASKH
jgi:ubiquinone/menaquinone biosynthesis C-methylase UbiE